MQALLHRGRRSTHRERRRRSQSNRSVCLLACLIGRSLARSLAYSLACLLACLLALSLLGWLVGRLHALEAAIAVHRALGRTMLACVATHVGAWWWALAFYSRRNPSLWPHDVLPFPSRYDPDNWAIGLQVRRPTPLTMTRELADTHTHTRASASVLCVRIIPFPARPSSPVSRAGARLSHRARRMNPGGARLGSSGPPRGR